MTKTAIGKQKISNKSDGASGKSCLSFFAPAFFTSVCVCVCVCVTMCVAILCTHTFARFFTTDVCDARNEEFTY